MSQPGETDGYSVSDHVEVLNRYLGERKVDVVIANNGDVEESVAGVYRGEDKRKAIEIAADASSHGKAVISGMAKGIDSYAHTAAVKSDGYTIAVLGSGPDICYPKEHYKLYDRICSSGCIVSEYPPGTNPQTFLFPERNRIIAALSDTLYVIDAGRNSGTKSTIAAAEKYGRVLTI